MRVYTNRGCAGKRGGFLKSVLACAASIGLLSAVAIGQSELQEPAQQADPQAQQELIQVQQQLQEVESRIQEIEKKAMQKEKLQQAQSEYFNELREAAIAINPDVENKFERQDELIDELEDSPELKMPAENRSPDINQKIGEFQQLRNEINPVVQQVAQQPEMQQRQAEFEETVIEEMKAVDPQTDELLAQRVELFGRYEKLSGRM